MIAGPGLGKSRLLAEVQHRLELPWLQLHGYETAREIPLGAAGGMLRAFSGVPGVGERLDALLLGAAGAGTGLETVRVFEAAFRCLERFGPLALAVDDIQWADAETLALLHYLLSAAHDGGLPLLLLCAGRPAVETSAFASGLNRLLAQECSIELALGPLDREEGIDLVVRLAPQLGSEEAEALWRQAQGSPFWLEALVAGDRPDVSPARLIRSRLAGLDIDAGQLFALLLVAAQPLSVADAAELLDWKQERARRAVAVLIDRALAVQEGGVARTAHDLIREWASRELPAADRSRLHRRLGDWFEAGAGEDVQQLSRALEHRRAGGRATAQLALRIARSPQRRLLGGEGLTTLGRIADETIDGNGIALQREVAVLASELGEWQEALERWAALVDRLPELSDRARAALAAATAAFRLGHADETAALVTRARELAPGDPLLALEADFREAQTLLWLQNRVPEAQPLVDRAVATAQRLAERAGGIDRLGDAECGAYVTAVRGALDAAIRRADADTVARCAELIQTSARDPAEALAAASDGVFSLLQFDGLPRSAEPRARRALEESQLLALPILEVEATHWLAWIAHHLGRLDEAAELIRQAVALGTRVGAPRRFTLAILRALAHSVEASRGDWRRAVAAIEQQIEAEPDPHFRLVVRMMHVWLVGRFAFPDADELDLLLLAMAKDAQVADCGRCRWESVLYGAEAQARIGDVDAAQTALEQWDAAHPRPRPGPAARRAYAAALVATRRDPSSAPGLYASAAQAAEQVGHSLMRLWIDLDAATALATVDRAAAVEALRSVALEAQTMGALSERQLAIQRLRALGVRAWRRRGNAAPLTPRELEIARFVVAGDSNPEIASTLFLSRKTVERHVSNILLKLGARNRTELASRLETSDDRSL